MPVGFKNATSGDLKAAVNGIIAATQSQTFLGITEDGHASAVTTGGNPDCQLILRGGADGPNYMSSNVELARIALNAVKAPTSIMIDCSHANSSKDPSRQPDVLLKDVEVTGAGTAGVALPRPGALEGIRFENVSPEACGTPLDPGFVDPQQPLLEPTGVVLRHAPEKCPSRPD